MTTIPIPLPGRSYDVHIGAGLLASLGERVRELASASRAMLVVDHNLPAETVAGAADSLRDAGYTVARFTVEATEDRKTLRTLGELLRSAAVARLSRSDPWIALGGGLVGDLAGFAAASYQRGAPVVQCPTTLLAMVDASVGGKTGVNLTTTDEDGAALLKNYVGAFWQPRAVLADIDTLESLPARELRCGVAECVKHAIIASRDERDFLSRTVEALPAVHRRDREAIRLLVTRNVEIKASIVEADEREEASTSVGGRALLNLGHTFAHVIEPMRGLTPTGSAADAPLKHGEAVGLGLIAAAETAVELDRLDSAEARAIQRAVADAGLPTRIDELPDADDLIDRMRTDKKVREGALRLVLPIRGGGCELVEEPPAEAIAVGWRAIGAG